uniref:Uncharacterized protein n=1 Tax=Romanomermis culicivorax TaxID=13658 RepID=A0A915J3U4_ROMCU
MNFPVPHAVKKNYLVPHLKNASRSRQTPLASQTTRPMSIMITRNHGMKCPAHLTAKKITASKQLSTICTH